MSKIERAFRLYRYQISTVAKEIQGDFMMNISTINDLVARKNDIFLNVLKKIDEKGFKYKRAPITHQSNHYETTSVIQLAANRPLKRTTKELVEEEIDNWPALIVVFDNRQDKQLLAIEMKQAIVQHLFCKSSQVIHSS